MIFWSFPLFPDQASSRSWEVDALFLGLNAVLLFFTGLISALIITFLVRYRQGTRGQPHEPANPQRQARSALDRVASVDLDRHLHPGNLGPSFGFTKLPATPRPSR